ncbi:NAD(P)H-hydrate epimerase [Lactobacillaceae bacterium L1_55_11]|nr:NAD(P)H-hydrate epimerase [Lactobacillaceae bacterium L1_55_11]
MIQLVSNEEMHDLESYLLDRIGVPQEVLIERAALAVMEVIGAGNFALDHVLVLAGLGNNGADGVAVARMLHLQGIPVTLQFVGNLNRAKDSVRHQLAIAQECGLTPADKSDFKEASLIIDAIFGTGLSRALPEGLQKMVRAANHIGNAVVAIDVPTGIDADTGKVQGAALKAHTTVSLGFVKQGLHRRPARGLAGDIVNKDIGLIVPPEFEFSLNHHESNATQPVAANLA